MNRMLMLLFAICIAAGLTACEDEAERDADRTATTTETARTETGPPEDEMDEDEMAEEEMAEDEMAEDEMAEGMASIEVGNKQPFGDYLTDSKGMSLYMFEADTQGEESTCYDACAQAWPPLTVESAEMLTAGEFIDDEMLGTIERRDGTMQVTYNGWPLYHFVKDQESGDTTGQDVEGFGAEWYLLNPQGEKIEEEGQALK